MSSVFISADPEKASGKGGNGPEDDARHAVNALRSHGLIALAFGFAVGFALVMMYIMINVLEPSGPLSSLFPQTSEVSEAVAGVGIEGDSAVSQPAIFTSDFFRNLGIIFLFGLVIGSLIAMIYNLLVVRRVNLFGLESSMD